MREILFRGKTKAIVGCPCNNGKPDGEWVNGYIFPDLGAMKIRQFEPDRPECNDYEVDPETVGQYTGLTDKNGVRIFEGDIVRYAERRLGGEDVSVAFPVTFDEGGFCAHHYFLNNWLRNGLGGNTKLEDIEVIGNIHDNPDILKGGGENG